ncbi:MAG TPA: prolyl oligopeptidase family serine peptidase [Dehalococcoidia bacterium]|jgi:prolyl oligopeptidase|nr:prolyl oligopeptidase family serine peptidase [Dehalococcoidia bacterium]
MTTEQLRPPATRVAPVDEVFHGENVPDPYRWLEDSQAPEVQAWTAAQNAYTRAVLGRFPGRTAIARRFTELLSMGSVTVPAVRRGRYFYQRREGAQNQPVLYVRDGYDGADRALVDPNTLSEKGVVALDWYYPSPDGRLLAYGLSEAGSEESTLYLLDVDTGAQRPDRIPRTRYTSLAWLPDGSAFYYSRYPEPGSVPPGEENYHRRVLLHRVGDDPAADMLIWSERRDMRESPAVDISPDGRWLLLVVSLGWDQADVYLRSLAAPDAGWVTVAEDVPALFWGEVYRDTLYLFTNENAPHYKVVAVPAAAPERENWREVAPERPDAVLTGGGIVGGRLALDYLVNASSRLELRGLDGAPLGEAALPALGSLAGISGEPDGDELFYGYTSFTTPMTVYRMEFAAGTTGEWATIRSSLDPDDVRVEQVWYDSTDGARVSMFIVRRSDVTPDGNLPVLLTGYGGFNISRTPAYTASAVFWLEQGGVFALPNLRGGGEYGEAWHRAGMLEQKQHTFDDFVRAAEYLIASGYTNPGRLAILGGSNGGLLVGAAITQRPELFRAAVCQVPLLDMLRYHRFLIARLWVTEYGGAEDPEQYRWLRAYSPYHHVREGVRYPAVLFTTAESDSRVHPMHARKMAALLQAKTGADPAERPVLLRVETEAGHGQGKPVGKMIDEQTDVWSFVCAQLCVAVAS